MIILNVVGAATLAVIVALKFIVKETEKEKLLKTTSSLDLIMGRKKKAKNTGVKEDGAVELFDIDVGTELGDIRKRQEGADDEGTFIGRNPMREKGKMMSREPSIQALASVKVQGPAPLLPHGWVVYSDALGREYYSNDQTGETVWERPVEKP